MSSVRTALARSDPVLRQLSTWPLWVLAFSPMKWGQQPGLTMLLEIKFDDKSLLVRVIVGGRLQNSGTGLRAQLTSPFLPLQYGNSGGPLVNLVSVP